ncbi:MAG: hypothetical protein II970_01055 [Paludibacteraceae bacterium]|nr:hypothetical protein [Paludibacteraceae bacterium]
MAENLLQRYEFLGDCANINAGKNARRGGGGDGRISCGARDKKACGKGGGGDGRISCGARDEKACGRGRGGGGRISCDENGLTTEDISMTVHPHPTLGEAIMDTSELADGVPIHI